MSKSIEHSESQVTFILQGEYFKIENQEGQKITAKCVNCSTTTLINGSLQATSNFLLHLKRKNGNLVEEYTKKQKLRTSVIRKITGQSKQCQTTPYVKKDATKSMTKTERLIVNYIVKGMRPLSTVEEPEFIELIQGLNPDAAVISRSTVERRIFERFKEMKQQSILKLKSADHVCITADAWTCKGKSRSFMGVTAHWIGPNLERNACAIACKRIVGTHSYDKIAKLITTILQDYEIPVSKVVKAVTDNGSNFVKAFEENASDKSEDCREGLSPDEALCNDDVIFEHVHEILESANPADEEEILLPDHHRCASHTLSLLCTANLAKSPPKKFKAVMAKCSGLWNKIGRSTKSAEIAKDILKRRLTTPCPTRWNSLYDSVKCLLQVQPTLNEVCTQLGLPAFSQADFAFLEEYAKCVEPVAVALDRLQGEKSVYFGELAPTLFAIERKLEALSGEYFQFCKSIPTTLLEGLRSRFASVMLLDVETNDALIAAMSHPYFKLRWVTQLTDMEKLNLRDKFIELACNKFSHKIDEVPEDLSLIQAKDKDNFFEFGEFSEPSVQDEVSEKTRSECLRFFKDRAEDVGVLESYPTVRKIFLKYNTCIPSSAPVERIFNYSAMILNPIRKSMSDELFEELTLLKVNNN